MRLKNFTGNFIARDSFPGELRDWYFESGSRHSIRAQIRQDAYSNRTLAEELLDHGRSRFCNRVYHVCSHGLTHIDKQLDDNHVLRQCSPSQIPHPTAPLTHRLALLIRKGYYALLLVGQDVFHVLLISDVVDLYLTNHHRRGRLTLKAATMLTDYLCYRRAGCDHRRFFHSHRHIVVLIVDEKSDPQPQGQRHDPNAILNHVIGEAEREPTL